MALALLSYLYAKKTKHGDKLIDRYNAVARWEAVL